MPIWVWLPPDEFERLIVANLITVVWFYHVIVFIFGFVLCHSIQFIIMTYLLVRYSLWKIIIYAAK